LSKNALLTYPSWVEFPKFKAQLSLFFFKSTVLKTLIVELGESHPQMFFFNLVSSLMALFDRNFLQKKLSLSDENAILL
jgi:hypothetical protein